jgi:ribosomal silencing factor RsfS
MKNYTRNFNADLIEHSINKLKDLKGSSIYVSDLHNEIFNTDYFIIGYYESEKWLNDYIGVFFAINIIKEYEEKNFGTIMTDLTSSEKVANMYAYIQGENLLNDTQTMHENWDKKIDDNIIDMMIFELNEML